MSDGPFMLLVSADRARDVSRAYEALADHLRDLGVVAEAGRAERVADWWMAYAIALAQKLPAEG